MSASAPVPAPGPAPFHGACPRIQDRLWHYVDRELSAPELSEISLHLKSCANCRQIYESRARDANLFRLAFAEAPFGDEFAEHFHERLLREETEIQSRNPGKSPGRNRGRNHERGPVHGGRAAPRSAEGSERPRILDGESSDPARRPGREASWIPSPRDQRRRWSQLAAAVSLAAIVLVVIAGFWLGDPSSLGRVRALAGAPRGLRSGRSLAELPERLLPGDRLVLQEKEEALLELRDLSTLRIQGPGSFEVDAASRSDGVFLARLDGGTVQAVVTPRDVRHQLRISTERAIAAVVGTRFTLKDQPGSRTILSVEEGEVRFLSVGREDPVPVNRRSGPYEVLAPGSPPRPVERAPTPAGPAAEASGEEGAPVTGAVTGAANGPVISPEARPEGGPSKPAPPAGNSSPSIDLPVKQ